MTRLIPIAFALTCASPSPREATDLAKASWIDIDRAFSAWAESEATVIERLQHSGARSETIARRIARMEQAVERWDWIALNIMTAVRDDDRDSLTTLLMRAEAMLRELRGPP